MGQLAVLWAGKGQGKLIFPSPREYDVVPPWVLQHSWCLPRNLPHPPHATFLLLSFLQPLWKLAASMPASRISHHLAESPENRWCQDKSRGWNSSWCGFSSVCCSCRGSCQLQWLSRGLDRRWPIFLAGIKGSSFHSGWSKEVAWDVGDRIPGMH